MKKLSFIVAVFMIFSLVFAGCTSATPDKNSPGTSAPESKELPKIAYITGTGGLGDHQFNDKGYEGIKRLEETGMAEADVIVPKAQSEMEGILRQLSETKQYALIVAMSGDETTPMKAVAPLYPDQNYLLTDGLAECPNVLSVWISTAQSAFLTGALAAFMDEPGMLPNGQAKGVVGVMGGMQNPLIDQMMIGYECGARYVDPDIKVLSAYVGSWTDANKGAEVAKSLYEQGVSTIFNGAGGAGLGIAKAAQDMNLYVTCGTNNQNSIAPDNIMASIGRSIDLYIEDAFKASLDGSFKGGDFKVSLKDNADALQILYEGSNVVVPQEVKDNMDKIIQMLAGSDAELPTDKAQIDAYLAEIGTFE